MIGALRRRVGAIGLAVLVAACRPSATGTPVPAASPSIASPSATPAAAVAPLHPAAAPAPSPQPGPLNVAVDEHAARIAEQVVAWRRDIHAHPELGNREVRTAKIVAEHLRGLGLRVRTEVAHTGVVGVLVGGRPGPVVALRADMDALPVHEQVDVPFASRDKATWQGRETFVMHACGHDMHTAILMGVASVLASIRDELPGTVVLLFQPAEEGPPDGERGGADLMIEQGALRDPKPDAIFGLHVIPEPVGEVLWRDGGALAASDRLHIVVHGRQTHGGYPWRGVDPVTVAAQVVLALQTIPSRQLDVTRAPSVVSIGRIEGGVRSNIIPDEVTLEGTIRTLDETVREQLHERIRRTARAIAESAGATADVRIDTGYPVTFNDPALTEWLVPTLRRVAGAEHVRRRDPVLGSEDFSRYQHEVPGVYFFVGIVPRGVDPADAPPNHSPHFFADEAALPLGVRALAHAAVDYLRAHPV